MPSVLKDAIRESLHQAFADENIDDKIFAVRSSACGEDSEETSAAGQMTTYLGVKGLNNICASVMKCWASQFGNIAVEYKRGYGQLINAPMAVVIQEIVDCDVAGVMFTCDPMTGDEREIILTANYGLGESVVSASAEPDTITLDVDKQKNVVRGVKKIVIGGKSTVIKISNDEQQESCGTVETKMSDDECKKCCLDELLAMHIGQIGLTVSLP